MKITSKNNRAHVLILATLFISICVVGCPSKPTPPAPQGQQAALSGQIGIPPGEVLKDTTVVAVLNGQESATAPVNQVTGQFKITLPGPGIYDLRLKTPRGALDFAAGVTAQPGVEASVGVFPAPVDLFNAAGTITQFPNIVKPIATEEARPGVNLAVVRGEAHPPEAQVRIMSGDKVIAQGKAMGGKFEIRSVPPGVYDIEYSAPGYTTHYEQNVAVAAEGALTNLNGYLLYESPLDGVNWQAGTVRATGLGKPNPGMAQPQAGLMACQAAKTVAYRNLLNTLLGIQVDPGKSIKNMGAGTVISNLNGFVQGARLIGESKRDDGVCVITLEVPIHGNNGVLSFVQKHIGK